MNIVKSRMTAMLKSFCYLIYSRIYFSYICVLQYVHCVSGIPCFQWIWRFRNWSDNILSSFVERCSSSDIFEDSIIINWTLVMLWCFTNTINATLHNMFIDMNKLYACIECIRLISTLKKTWVYIVEFYTVYTGNIH